MARKAKASPAPRETPIASAPSDQAGAWAGAILALTLFLAPTLGARTEDLLQDTLKSMVVGFGVIFAWAAYLLRPQAEPRRLYVHALGGVVLALFVYALGSMAWSHAYLAGVEAVRWWVLGLLFLLGLQVWRGERLAWMAWGVFGGGVMASLWAALQFWFSFDLFSQGPNPASTFVNRNFFAEYAVCTLPFGLWLLAERRRSGPAAALGLGVALITVAIMMTGTRSALTAMWLLYLVLAPLAGWRWRRHWALAQAPRAQQVLVAAVFVGALGAMSVMPSDNLKVLQEARGVTAWERAVNRTASIRPDDGSLGVRMTMWRATLRMVAAHPVLGVGAGAWEHEVPRFQTESAALETDYYAHNEYLQLLAEYGLLGAAALLALAGFVIRVARRIWNGTARPGGEVAALLALCMLAVVSLAGFPWRMAATGALMTVCLAALAASGQDGLARSLAFPARVRLGLMGLVAGLLMLGFHISDRATRAEFHLISAARLAISLTATGEPLADTHLERRREMLAHVRQGIALNPHYRKVTPMVADELARWGDWRNAVWIWESVLESRPYIVGILTNVGRGYLQLGDRQKAADAMRRAQAVAPSAPAVRSLEILLVNAEGQTARAWELAKAALDAGILDRDIVAFGFALGVAGRELDKAREFIERGVREWPETRVSGYMQLGRMYATVALDANRALEAFRQAFQAAPPEQWPMLARQVPESYHEALRAALRGPAKP